MNKGVWIADMCVRHPLSRALKALMCILGDDYVVVIASVRTLAAACLRGAFHKQHCITDVYDGPIEDTESKTLAIWQWSLVP